MTMAKAAVLGACVTATAQAGGLSAAAGPGYEVPAELSMLVWAPVLRLTAACVIARLWMIGTDARRSRALNGSIQPRRGFYLAGRRVADLQLHLHH
jgi:hypothetical protein